MKVIQISDYLTQYQFVEEQTRVTYYTSVFAITRFNDVLLIDTGYKSYAKEIKYDLESKGLQVTKVIISHYHRDHAEGSLLFKKAQQIASHAYKANLHKCQNYLEGETYKKPDIIVSDSYEFSFYDLSIKIYETPGHTPCGLSVLINNEYLHVSDLLLEDINGKMIIPYIDLNSDPKNHLVSLKKFYSMEFKYFLLTHGQLKEKKDSFLSDRIYYLEQFINFNYQCKLSDCLMYDEDHYAMKEIHRLNLRNAKKLFS